MRLVVTGATGFVGSHFADRALREGHEVVATFCSDSAEKRPLREALSRSGATLLRADVLDVGSLGPAMKSGDCVCHFAAAFRESGVPDDYFITLNVQGTINAMKAAAEAGVRRFVLCSTAGIYGQRVSGVIDEASPAHPWNVYERSKLEAENVVRQLAPSFGMEYVTLRPAAVYGPRDQRLLKLFRSAARGRFPLFGAGSGRRHMVYVTDLADAFMRACVAPAAASQEVIIAGPEAVPLRRLLAELAAVVGRPKCGPTLPLRPMQWLSAGVEDTFKLFKMTPPLYRRRMDFYLNDTAFSTRRAAAALGWRPEVHLSDGLARTFRSYCEDGLIGAVKPRSAEIGSK